MDAFCSFEPYGTKYSGFMWSWFKPGSPRYSNYVDRYQDVPLTGQGNMYDLRIGGILATEFFTNAADAYNYMYTNSYDLKGNPFLEISAWKISSGIIVMPSYKNSLSVSYNDYLPVRTFDNQRYVYYNSKWNLILGHIHTHPSYHNNQIGVSNKNYDMMDWLGVPITILWNNRIWMVFDRVNNPVDLGKW